MSLGIEILIFGLECIMQLLCIHALLNKKQMKSIKSMLTIFTYILLLVIVNCFGLSRYTSMLAIIILFVYVLFEFRISVIDSIIVIMLNMVISSSIQVLGAYPIIKIFKNNIEENPLLLMSSILSVLLMIIVNKVINLSRIYSLIIKWDKLIIKVLGVIFVLFFLLYINYKTEATMALFAYFISALFMCLAVKMALDWNKDRYEMKQKSLELHMYELYSKTFEGMIENIRIRQHDFKNQLAAIYGMHLTSENFEDLVARQRQYCDYLMEESRYDSILTKCHDKIFAGYLYTKFTEWEKRGVHFQFNICLNDSKCELATYELIEISGVLIDNAAEAELCKNSNSIVEFILKDDKDTVTIISRNNSEYVPMEQINLFFKKGYSTKGENRGIGLYDVKRILIGKGDIIVSNKIINDVNYIEFKIEINR